MSALKMPMRVLPKEDAEQATAETILSVEPTLRETMLTTLSGEGVLPGGIVAEADRWTVADAIDTAAEKHHAPSAVVRNARTEEVEWLAGILAAYEVGSRVVQHLTHSGCVIDFSKAKRLSGPIVAATTKPDERGDYGSLATALDDSPTRGTPLRRALRSCGGVRGPEPPRTGARGTAT